MTNNSGDKCPNSISAIVMHAFFVKLLWY